MSDALTDAIEFACYYKACAPPPVGKGGSRGGPGSGKASRATRAQDVARRGKALRGYIKAKKAGNKAEMERHVAEYRRARNVVADNRSARGVGVGAVKGRTRRTGEAVAQRALRTAAANQQKNQNARLLPKG